MLQLRNVKNRRFSIVVGVLVMILCNECVQVLKLTKLVMQCIKKKNIYDEQWVVLKIPVT